MDVRSKEPRLRSGEEPARVDESVRRSDGFDFSCAETPEAIFAMTGISGSASRGFPARCQPGLPRTMESSPRPNSIVQQPIEILAARVLLQPRGEEVKSSPCAGHCAHSRRRGFRSSRLPRPARTCFAQRGIGETHVFLWKVEPPQHFAALVAAEKDGLRNPCGSAVTRPRGQASTTMSKSSPFEP